MKCKGIFLLMLIFSLFSCDRFHENNYDFPKHITFPAEGGTQYYLGGTKCYGFYIYEIDDVIGKVAFSEELGDSLAATYDWMTVHGKMAKDGLTIIAAPNTSKDSRFLNIRVDTNVMEYGIIKVKQEGKKG